MPDVTLYGFPISTYVRTARIALEEKGVKYDLNPLPPHDAELVKHQPFGKVPALKHGDFEIYETAAITRYVDEAFPGPALQPKDVKDRARMEQWISVINGHVYPTVIGSVVLEHLAPKLMNRPTDTARIKAAVPNAELQLGLFERALAKSPNLAGSAPSLADYFAAPILYYFSTTPEGGPMIAGKPKVAAWLKGLLDRKSAKATQPQLG